jgi:hypothetical protein
MSRIAYLFAAALFASAASAQTATPVDRQDLDEAFEAPILPPALDTALVFSNPHAVAVSATCRGFDADGNAIGETTTSVPARGLRFLLASDVSLRTPFLGSVNCVLGSVMNASGFLLGGAAGVTDVPAHVRIPTRKDRDKTIVARFPVVATR